ncbi:MAG: EpsG family protein [Streptococcaceae bacterium]|jgi:hypothetical protein|nr:EpsG family protein [Streptococcaceae bacterium]
MKVYLLFLLLVLAATTVIFWVERYNDRQVSYWQPTPTPMMHNHTFYFIGLSLVLILFAGLRGDSVGSDTGTYKIYYMHLSSYYEPGFVALQNFFAQHGFSFTSFKVLVSFLTVGPIMFTINKLSPYKFLSVYLFFATYSYFYSFNIMRQYVALAFILVAVYFILWVIKHPIGKYAICLIAIIVTYNFHKSSIVISPLLLLGMIKMSERWQKRMLIIGAILLVCLPPLSAQMLSHIPGMTTILKFFADGDSPFMQNRSGTLRYLLSFVKGGLVFFMLWLANINKASSLAEQYLYRVALILFILYSFKFNAPAFTRIMQYADGLLIFIIPFLLSKIEQKKWRLVLTVGVVGFFFVNLLAGLQMNIGEIAPYHITK